MFHTYSGFAGVARSSSACCTAFRVCWKRLATLFVSSLGAVGVLGAILPLLATVGLTALEFLVAALQAYVFAILTSLYLNDALHPGH